MAALADALQISQSAVGTSVALLVFVGSPRRGRGLAEDIGFGFMGGVVIGSALPLIEALNRELGIA